MTAARALSPEPVPADGAHVGDLPARLGVQRGAVQHQFDPVRDGGLAVRGVRDHRHPLAVDEDAQNPCLGGQFVEAGELGGAGVDQLAVGGQVGVRVLARGGVGLGALALLHISSRKPVSSTVRPASAAISRVSSIGNP